MTCLAENAGTILANNTSNTGSGYVEISHGEITSGAYNGNAIVVAGTPARGAKELLNANNQTLHAFYVADNFDASAAPAYFDDLVAYKTVHWVVCQTRLDTRPH